MVRKRSCPAVSHTCVAQAQRATDTVRRGHRRLHRHARSFVAYLQLHFLSEQIHALELVVDANGCDELGTADAASPPRKRTTHQDDGLRKVTAGRCCSPELVVHETPQQTCFANSHVANEQDLQAVLKIALGSHGSGETKSKGGRTDAALLWHRATVPCPSHYGRLAVRLAVSENALCTHSVCQSVVASQR